MYISKQSWIQRRDNEAVQGARNIVTLPWAEGSDALPATSFSCIYANWCSGVAHLSLHFESPYMGLFVGNRDEQATRLAGRSLLKWAWCPFFICAGKVLRQGIKNSRYRSKEHEYQSRHNQESG